MFTQIPQVPSGSIVTVEIVRNGITVRRTGPVAAQTTTSITLRTAAGRMGRPIYFPRNVKVVGYVVPSEA